MRNQPFMMIAAGNREAVLESSGRFTICCSRQLSRIRRFTLADPDWWVLRVLQALVRLEARDLSIVITATVIEFEAEWQGEGFLERLEAALWRMDEEVEPALEYLRQALWSVSRRPFKLGVPGQDRALLWDGQALRLAHQAAPTQLKLTVWHGRSLYPWNFLSIRRAVVQQLMERAFFCPIPLSLNGRRLDALARARFPVALGFCPGRNPRLPIPLNALLMSQSLRAGPLGLCRFVVHASQVPARSVAAGMIQLLPRGCGQSRLLWIRDGVVVDEDELEIPRNRFALILIASADGLENDSSDFRLVRNRDHASRFKEVLNSALPFVANSEVSLRDWLARRKLRGRLQVGIALVAIVSMAFYWHDPSWLLLMAALWVLHPADFCEFEREFELKASLALLKADYRRLLAAYS